MPDQTNIKGLNLSKPDAQQALPGLIDELFRHRDAVQAADLLRRINAQPGAEALRQSIEASMPKLTLLVLPLMSEEQMATALDQSLAQLIELDADLLLERLTIAVESLPLSNREQFKERLLDRCSGNNSSLTEAPLALANGQIRLPTVGNWVREYLALRQAQLPPERFLQTRPNAANFSKEDRQRLAGLVQMLVFLTTPSNTVEGLEEDIPVGERSGPTGVLEHGQIAPLPDSGIKRPLVPPKRMLTGSGKPAAAFYFHPEDEAEIRQHAERLSGMNLGVASREELADATIQQLLQDQNLTFSEDLLYRRFRTALTALLKGIRSSQDTQDLLMRPVKIGGLGLPPEKSAAILAAASAVAVKFHDQQGLADLHAENVAREQAQAPPPPVPVQSQPSAPVIPQPVNAIPVPAPKRVQFNNVRILSPRPNAFEHARLDDIRQPQTKSKYRTVGPLDELRTLGLQEFRTFGTDAVTAIHRLKERFDVLGKESYALRVQGIMAWRTSPLYQLYLEMGSESMESRQPIAALAAARKQRSAESLTDEEFTAIADLNRVLRF